jgi:hypothetical protein
MWMLLEHARDDDAAAASGPVSAVRVPIPAPAKIWSCQTPAPVPPASRRPDPEQQPTEPVAMVCRLCAGRLERTRLAAAMDSPMSQGWVHVDGRKTHLPDPVASPR